MFMIAMIAGFAVALVTVLGIKAGKTENQPWAYPLVLATYPLFYFAFAVYAGSIEALLYEVLYALPIFAVACIAAIKNLRFTLLLLAIGYFAHGVYDIVHEHLFINPGMPAWWPAFCGTIDILIAAYLAFQLRQSPTRPALLFAND